MSGEFAPRLWTLLTSLAAVCCAASVVVARRRERRARERLAALLDAGHGRAAPASAPWTRPRILARRWGPPLGVVITGWVLVGGIAGWAVGLAGAYAVRRRLRSRKRDDPDPARAAEAARQLPLAADLLAACLTAGAGPREAAEAVGESLGGPVGDRLARTAAELRLGGEPAEVWGRLTAVPGATGLARCLERAGATGAPAAEPVSRLAEGLRAERSRAAVARAQRAQVLITAPVGLCFLPAFLAVGVAPVVIGLASALLTGD
ncbi:type II secretion system F family protein [Streptomyces sp. NPDC088258]|uniref:type II secretion system F family protein n=1 Tax=Streptomyces sp. NPDC088258 TaxID=3365849 RepID=UPI00381268D3